MKSSAVMPYLFKNYPNYFTVILQFTELSNFASKLLATQGIISAINKFSSSLICLIAFANISTQLLAVEACFFATFGWFNYIDLINEGQHDVVTTFFYSFIFINSFVSIHVVLSAPQLIS